MTRALLRISLLASLSLLALPSVAAAAPTPWAGTSFNNLGPASALLSVTQDGRASVTNVQLILACTDAEDGTESDRAFDARYRNREPLNRNRFAFDFSALSGGRLGRVDSTASCALTAAARPACASRRRRPARVARSSSAPGRDADPAAAGRPSPALEAPVAGAGTAGPELCGHAVVGELVGAAAHRPGHSPAKELVRTERP